MNLLAALLAAAECAGLFQAAPAPAPVSWQSDCLPAVIDGTGAAAEACFAEEHYHSVDGAALGVSGVGVSFLSSRARGFWAVSNAVGDRALMSIDRDGTLLGSLPTPIPGGDPLTTSLLLADPNGSALLLDVVPQPGGTPAPAGPPWQLVLRRVSSTMTVIDGPRVIDSGPSSAPSFQGKVSTDGSFVLTESGWHFPPLRNNQTAARWFDAAGTPLGGWFAALDQAPSGGAVLTLGDGSVIVDARYRRTRLAKDPGPPPSWLPAEVAPAFASPRVFVLPDRVAVVRPSAAGCGIDLEIHAPSGALCGSQTIPLAKEFGFCLQGFAIVGPEGTLLVRSYGENSVQVWPRLFAPTLR